MSFVDKAKHKAEEAAGAAKEAYGQVSKNERIRVDGAAQRSEAKAKQAGDHVKDAGRDARDAFGA